VVTGVILGVCELGGLTLLSTERNLLQVVHESQKSSADANLSCEDICTSSVTAEKRSRKLVCKRTICEESVGGAVSSSLMIYFFHSFDPVLV
jgi:hypothetical protein